jgi:hypothetical protein
MSRQRGKQAVYNVKQVSKSYKYCYAVWTRSVRPTVYTDDFAMCARMKTSFYPWVHSLLVFVQNIITGEASIRLPPDYFVSMAFSMDFSQFSYKT